MNISIYFQGLEWTVAPAILDFPSALEIDWYTGTSFQGALDGGGDCGT